MADSLILRLLYNLLEWSVRNQPPIPVPMKSPTLPERIARIAESKVGLKESPSGSNRGPEIQEFFDADSYDPNGKAPGDSGYAWCAAFVDRIVQLAMLEDTAVNRTVFTFARPTTPGAWDMERWSLAQDNSTHTKKPPLGDILRGDIVVFTFSHIGIATGPPDKNGAVPTIEGNTNKAGEREGIMVMRKKRHISEIRSRIRFTV